MPNTPKIVTRSETTSSNTVDNLNKGSKLTFAEMDSNFLELRNGSIGVVADDSATIDVKHGDTLYIQGGTNVTTSTDSAGVLTINATGEVTADSTTTFTNKTFDANGTGNSISNLEVADFAASAVVTAAEGIASNDNDTTIPTSAAVKAYADSVGGGSTGDLSIIGSTITAPSNADLTLTVAGTGSIVVDGSLTATDITSDLTGTIEFNAKATEAITKGEAVYIAGIDGNTPTVALARANASGTMPAFGIAADDIALNATGKITTFGSLTGLDAADFGETSITFALGDTIYISSAEAGKLTNVAPTGEANFIQNIGKIERATPTTNITIKVGGAGRSNATPALNDGNIFIGNASNQSVTTNLQTQVEAYSINNVVEDTTPQLGGDLDLNSNDIIGTGNVNITGSIGNEAITIAQNNISATRSGDDLVLSSSGSGDIRLDGNRVYVGDDDSTGPNPYRYYSTTTPPMISAPNSDDDLVFRATDSGTNVGGRFVFLNGSGSKTYVVIRSGSPTTGQSYVGGAGPGAETIIANGLQFEDNLSSDPHTLFTPPYQTAQIKVKGGAYGGTGDIDLIPYGSGEVNITNVDIGSGAIDGTTIGAASAAAGTFTDLSANGTITMNSNRITNVTDPTAAQDAATKAYVDANAGATTGDITFVGSTMSSPSNANFTIETAGTGKIILTGITFPDTDGTADQVLGTNGSGVLSFRDPTAINIDGGTADSIYTSVPTIDGGTA